MLHDALTWIAPALRAADHWPRHPNCRSRRGNRRPPAYDR